MFRMTNFNVICCLNVFIFRDVHLFYGEGKKSKLILKICNIIDPKLNIFRSLGLIRVTKHVEKIDRIMKWFAFF